MGLDMMLDKHYYHSKHGKDGKGRKKKVNKLEVKETVCEAMYWRKSNEIHRWFVENVQNDIDDCGTYEVSREQLKELLGLVRKALIEKDTSILPTTSGFFFGSTEYDNYYWQDMERTEKELSALLENDDGEGWFTYHASW